MGARRIWTPEEDAIIMSVGSRKAAEMIGVSKSGVSHRRQHLLGRARTARYAKEGRRAKPFPEQGTREWKKRDDAFVKALIKDAYRLGLVRVSAPEKTLKAA